jgi:hypothetical protein
MVDWAGDEAGIKAIFTRARAEAPCLLVLEDLDSLITDMNRSFFLNEVDGIEGNDGLLLVGPSFIGSEAFEADGRLVPPTILIDWIQLCLAGHPVSIGSSEFTYSTPVFHCHRRPPLPISSPPPFSPSTSVPYPLLHLSRRTLTPSPFPNPSKGERRQYAEYWQKKLESNKDINFPNELLDQFADRTDKFSFAYMKEVL